MPPVIVGVAAGVAAAGTVSAAAAIAIGIGAAALTYAATPKFDVGSFANEAFSQQQMLRSPVEPRRGIYGRAMVSGPLVFAEETGKDNAYLHIVIPLAGHRCDGIEKIYFGDEVVWTNGNLVAKYANVARLKVHLGDQTKSDPNLTSECSKWTSAHVGFGVTYIYARLKFDTKVFPNGVPNIKALVRGKRVYDPRKNTHNWDNPATWEWSDNWALCCLDYNRFESGVGASAHEIDLSYFAAAANDSDQLVEYQTGKFEKRYTCNGTYNQDVSPSSIMEKMLTAGAGMHVYVSGKYRLYAGVYQGPEVLVLTENDAAGDIDVRPYTPRAELCNAVRGTFVDPENFYQPTDFPPYESSYYRAQDDGEYIDHDLDLPFTQSVWTAQRLGKLYLEQKRAGMQIVMPVKMIGVAVSVGKVVGLSLPRLGIDGTFQIVNWQFDYGKPVSLILVETSPELFDFALGSYTERDLTPNVILPNPATVPTPINLQYLEYQDDPQWQGELTWSAPANNSSYRYVIEVSNGLGEIVYQTNADATRSMLPKLDTGFYTVSLWALNLFANRSNVPATLTIGATLPAPVTGIAVIAGPLTLTLRPTTTTTIAQTTQFEVLGGISTDITEATQIGTGKEAVWPDRHPNTRYQIWARTVNNHGVSSWYGPVQATTSADNTSIIDLIGNTFKNYTWFAWADDASGTGFTTVEALGDGKAYMGIATDKPTASPSGNWQDYTWTKIKTEIPPVFTPEEETKLDNLLAGKLPNQPNKDMLAAQDALKNPALANNLITALSLLNLGINAPALGGETPASAQAKASAAKLAAIAASAPAYTDQKTVNFGGFSDYQYRVIPICRVIQASDGNSNKHMYTTGKLVFKRTGGNGQLVEVFVNAQCGYNSYWNMFDYEESSNVSGITPVTFFKNGVQYFGVAIKVAAQFQRNYFVGSHFDGFNDPIVFSAITYFTANNAAIIDSEIYKSIADYVSNRPTKSNSDYVVNGNKLETENGAQVRADSAKLQAVGDIAAGRFTAQTALIQQLISNVGLFNQLQAQLGVFGGLAANSIAARAITVDKLDVTARNFVNNVSQTGSRTGWSGGVVVDHTHKGKVTKALEVSTSGDIQIVSNWFDIDHTKIYEVNFTIYRVRGGTNGYRYFGMHANNNGAVNYVSPSTRAVGGATSNFYFWYGDIADGQYRQMRGYIIGSEVAPASIPESLNVASCCLLNPSTKQVRLRALNYYNNGVTTVDRWLNMSVTEIGGGQISANQLLANSGLFNQLKAKLASFGGLTANEIKADTALINKLVGNSALFNDLVARLAVFGGLTANSIASNAILGRHIRAGEKISSPIIEGGEVRLIGTAFMKVQSATAFGPDGLVEWYGPKLLVNGSPDWANLRKSNATTYLSANGDAYFGGSLSAGILKTGVTNPDKNSYSVNSYPVQIGPFGSNGKAKTVVVAFSLRSSAMFTRNPGTPIQPKLSWQLQRKIGTGGWVTLSSGVFYGSTTVNYEPEPPAYWMTLERCSGAYTYTDNTRSTLDFNYRVQVISFSRFHISNFVSTQALSLISTEQ